MDSKILLAVDAVVAHAMKTVTLDLWPHIKVVMDDFLLVELEKQKKAALELQKVAKEKADAPVVDSEVKESLLAEDNALDEKKMAE